MCNDFSNSILNINPRLRDPLSRISESVKKHAQEICIKINQPVIIFTSKESFFLGNNGVLSSENLNHIIVSQNDIFETMKILCNFSIYSFQDQIKNGFITVKGGHRAGLCGTAIINNNEVINVSDISSINLRISREVSGCSNEIFNKFGINLGGTLIAGPPSSGKTTILRDISKKISTTLKNGRLIKTTIIDERNEISAIYNGIPQKDVGLCDVLTGFSKSDGIIRAIRTMSPDIIICDEIGNNDDAESIKKSLNCGVEIIASIHAKNVDEISKSKRIRNILNSGAIKHVILLNDCNKPGSIKNIFEVEGTSV